MNKVVLIAEIAERDIPSRIEIANRIRANATCEIFIIEQELARILPGFFYKNSIVLDKSLANNKGKKKFFRKLRKNHATILVEDQEANAMLVREQMFFQSRFTQEMINYINEFYVWTALHYRKIIEHCPDAKHKLFITGSANYSYIHSKRKSLSKGRYILFNSNYSLLTNYDEVDQYISFRNSQFLLGEEMEEKTKLLWSDTNQKFQLFCAEIKNDLSEGRALKVRHHPSEDPKKLQALLLSNGIELTVNCNLPLFQDLKYAHTLKHIGCNSKLDAALVSVPSYDIKERKFDDPTIADDYRVKNAIEHIASRITHKLTDENYQSSTHILKIFSPISNIHQFILRVKNGSKMKSRWQKWKSIKMLRKYIPEIKSHSFYIEL